MRSTGVRSAASLSVVKLPGRHHPPPAYLTPDQATLWKQVTGTKPTEWFTSDTHPMLAAYCRHAATANLLGAEIDALEAGKAAPPSDEYAKLLSHRERETGMLLKLATAMRLTQHSRYKSETAATKAANAGDSNKPWNTQGHAKGP